MLLGIILAVIFLSILIIVHELGHFWAAKKFGLLVEEFGIGLPPRIWGKKIGETIYSINALPVGGFVKIFGENREGEAATANRHFTNLVAWKRGIVIGAGVLMNFLVGWIVISSVFFIGIPGAVFIAEVSQNSPAQEIGLVSGDKISGFENVESFIVYVDQNRGKEIVLNIERDGKPMDFKAAPRENPPVGQGALGVSLIEAGSPKQDLPSSVWSGLKASFGIIRATFSAFFHLIANVFIGKGSLEAVTGPVGIVKIINQASGLGIVYLLQLLALISLNLAVLNILPFPAVDGGRLMFLIFEKIKGSPLPEKFERYANALGMALLLFLMLIITIKDITRLW
ncbi:MAG: RIP metalloprotease RseP [Patescibacteria group bacterium]